MVQGAAPALRVLFDCHTFDAGPQGTTTFLAGLINALPGALGGHPAGREARIFCACADAAAAARYLRVPFEHVPIATGMAARNLWCLPAASRRLRADLVVSQYVRPLWAHGATATVIHDLLFLDFPDSFPLRYRLPRTLLFYLSARFSDRVFTVSDYSRRRIAARFGLAPEDLVVLPNAVGSWPPAPRPRPVPGQGALTLLCVARVEPRKRQDWCLRALEDLLAEGRDLRLRLIGAGEGAYAREVCRQVAAAAARYPGRVQHLWGLDDGELAREYAAADLFLFPSQAEGFGLPVIEAAAAGLPCVVADGSALEELKGSYAGAAFPSGDYRAFLAAVKRVLDDLEAHARRAVAAAPGVLQRYSWGAAADRLVRAALAREARP